MTARTAIRRLSARLTMVLLATCAITFGTGGPSRAGVDTPNSKIYFVAFDGGNYFLNYDGSEYADLNRQRHTRDWPITLLYWNSASVDKVKNKLGDLYQNSHNSREWEGYQLHPHRTRFDGDKGKKTECYNQNRVDRHFRIYGPSGSGVPRQDRFYGPNWGYFVVASSHFDFGDGDCSGKRKFGYSEHAAQIIARDSDIVGMRETKNYLQLYNRERLRYDKYHHDHVWQNDGKASVLRVP
jgi:hypothetical protein